MSTIKYIQNPSELKKSENWSDSKKFLSKGRTVSYQNNQYRLIAKKERECTTWERAYRGFFGLIAVVFSLGCSKYGKKLLVEKKVKIRYAILDNSSKLEISKELVEKIKASFLKIQNREKTEGITFYPSQSNHRVFSFDSDPDYIFKMNANNNVLPVRRYYSMNARHDKIMKARTICKTHDLGLLVIPDTRLFSIKINSKTYEILAEKKLHLNSIESAQEEDFEKYAESLNETIRQLAVFICKTGYSDVEWRNNPVISGEPDDFGNRKIALIDIEEMDSKTTGLFGGYQRRGLVRCVTKKQGNIVKKVAIKHEVKTSRFAKAHKKRISEIKENRQLKEFHKEHNIETGYEPIEVDVDGLELNLNETWEISELDVDECKLKNKIIYKKREIALREVVENVVKEINELIENKPEGHSIKGARKVFLYVDQDPFNSYLDLGANLGFLRDEEEEKKLWLVRILNALVEKEYLFKYNKTKYGYIIQA